MKDTPVEVACRHHEMLIDLPPKRHLSLLSDMYDFARQCARAGIVADDPQATEAEIRKQIFLRFYEHDLPRPLIERALQRIDERYAEHSPVTP